LRVAQEELEADEDFAGDIPEPVSRYSIEEAESHVFTSEVDYLKDQPLAELFERLDVDASDIAEAMESVSERYDLQSGFHAPIDEVREYLVDQHLTVHVTCSECGEAIT
jgi:hypothetical protein